MTRRKLTWGRIVRAEAPGAAELAETERQLAQLDPAQLTAQTIARISDEVAGRFRFRQPRRRSRSFGLLQLLALLLAFASTASVGPKVHWPMAPARLPAASLGDAIDWLADSSSSKSDLQVAMGVVDRHVFKALTTLKLLAGDDGQVGATARKAIAQLDAAGQRPSRSTRYDVPTLTATARDDGAPVAARLGALQQLADGIAAGVAALRAVELHESDLRIARDVYAGRLGRDIAKAAQQLTSPAASDSAPTAPRTPPNAR